MFASCGMAFLLDCWERIRLCPAPGLNWIHCCCRADRPADWCGAVGISNLICPQRAGTGQLLALCPFQVLVD